MDTVMNSRFGQLVMAHDPRHGKDEYKSYEALIVGFETERHDNVLIYPIHTGRNITRIGYKPKAVELTRALIDQIESREVSSQETFVENLDGENFELGDVEEIEDHAAADQLLSLYNQQAPASALMAAFDSRLEGSDPDFAEHAHAAVEQNLGSDEVDDGKLSLAQAEAIFPVQTVVASTKGELDNLHKFEVFKYLSPHEQQAIARNPDKVKLS